MNKLFTHKLLAGLTIGCLASLSLAGESPPIKLELKAPSGKGDIPLLSESGWPIILKMVINDEDNLGFFTTPNFPQLNRHGILVISDEDECLSIVGPTPSLPCDSQPPEYEWPANETYMEFYTGTDLSGVADNRPNDISPAQRVYHINGDSELRERLVDSKGSGGAQFQNWYSADTCIPGTPQVPAPEGGAPGCITIGPYTGEEAIDGYGLGTDDDLPGLVLISNMGIGKAFDEPAFNLPAKQGVRNLAGLITSISYELSTVREKATKPKGSKGKPDEATLIYQSTFWAHINFPKNVIRPIVQLDTCVGDVELIGGVPNPNNCSGDELWRIDGGPIEPVINKLGINPGRLDYATAPLMNMLSYEITAFMVSGTAPTRLYDEDRDGDVDSVDAAMAGYTVISNQDHVEFLLLSEEVCHGGGGNGFYEDLDGNGWAAPVSIVCPGGPGDLSRPPR